MPNQPARPCMQRSWKLIHASLRPGILERLVFLSAPSHLRISLHCNNADLYINHPWMATLLHCQHYASQSPSHLIWIAASSSCAQVALPLISLALAVGTVGFGPKFATSPLDSTTAAASSSRKRTAHATQALPFCSPASGPSGVILGQDKPAALLSEPLISQTRR